MIGPKCERPFESTLIRRRMDQRETYICLERIRLNDLRVMSFNLRYGTADDRQHSWPDRKELAATVIADFDADLIGTQESVGFQTDFLRSRFSQYTCLRRSRDAEPNSGESVDIFFRTRRFTLADSGHFWLSDQPDVPGSQSWDSRYPRLVAWCGLIDHQAADQPVHFFNTHFDYKGAIARVESARLLRQKIDAIAGDHRVIVAGDFNADEDDLPYQILRFGSQPSTNHPISHRRSGSLIDSWRAIHPQRGTDEGTRHDFRGDHAGPRIDWILHSHSYATADATILGSRDDDRFPSDHHPITAILRPV